MGRKISKISFLLIVFAMLILTVGCSKKPAALVNGEKITQKDLDRAVALSMGPSAASMKDPDKQAARSQVLQGLIGEKLALQEAKARGFTVSDGEVDNQMARISKSYGKDVLEKQLKNMNIDMGTFKQALKEQILMGKLIDSLVPDGSVSDGDAMNFYKSRPEMFMAPAQVDVRIVQASTLDDAGKIAAQMKSGGFDRVADRYLNSKTVGVGDYSWTPVNIYGPEMGKELSSVKEGSFGGPFKTHDGYLLVGLKGRKPASAMGFNEVEGQIKAMLLNQKRKQAILELIARKKASADIKIYN